jgi:hypothetical protein
MTREVKASPDCVLIHLLLDVELSLYEVDNFPSSKKVPKLGLRHLSLAMHRRVQLSAALNQPSGLTAPVEWLLDQDE